MAVSRTRGDAVRRAGAPDAVGLAASAALFALWHVPQGGDVLFFAALGAWLALLHQRAGGSLPLVVGTPAMQVNRVSTINMANIADTLATADGPEIFWGPDGPLQNPMKEESDVRGQDAYKKFAAACASFGVDLNQPDITVRHRGSG